MVFTLQPLYLVCYEKDLGSRYSKETNAKNELHPTAHVFLLMSIETHEHLVLHVASLYYNQAMNGNKPPMTTVYLLLWLVPPKGNMRIRILGTLAWMLQTSSGHAQVSLHVIQPSCLLYPL